LEYIGSLVVRSLIERLSVKEYRDLLVIGKFGQGKRRYSLNYIQAKLPETSGSVIAMTFLVMNLEKFLRGVFLHF